MDRPPPVVPPGNSLNGSSKVAVVSVVAVNYARNLKESAERGLRPRLSGPLTTVETRTGICICAGWRRGHDVYVPHPATSDTNNSSDFPWLYPVFTRTTRGLQSPQTSAQPTGSDG
jgi:hypothetical protein